MSLFTSRQNRPVSPLAYCLLVPVMLLGLLVVAFMILRATNLLKAFTVSSSGMAPTFVRGDMVMMEGISLAYRGISRGLP